MARSQCEQCTETITTLYIDLFPANLSAEGHNGRIQPIDCSYNKQLSEQQQRTIINIEMNVIMGKVTSIRR